MIRLFIPLLFLFSGLQGEDPWGVDAEMARTSIQASPAQGGLARTAKAIIRFHQKTLSPADGPRSHYYPSSSRYTYEAIQKYGFWQGYFLGCDRLLRENSDPWLYPITYRVGPALRWDPVP